MLHLTKGVQNTKKAVRQHVVNNQKTYPSTDSQNTVPQHKIPYETFTFIAEQLTKFVTNVVMQIVGPQFATQTQNKTH